MSIAPPIKKRRVFTRTRVIVLVILFLIGGCTALLSAIIQQNNPTSWWGNFIQNLAPEAFGALITFFLIDLVAEQLVEANNQLAEAQKRELETRKQNLILRLGSFDNLTAAESIRELWYSGWLQDGSVRDAKLLYANLEGADFGVCDLRGVNFYRANLRDARMWADLRGAHFIDADLENTRFVRPSDLPHPPNPILLSEGYRDINPERALFDHTTILPDGQAWSEQEGYDLKRFTDRKHAKFWRSERWQSPAYKDGDNSYRKSVRNAQYSDIQRVERKLDEILDQLKGER